MVLHSKMKDFRGKFEMANAHGQSEKMVQAGKIV